MTWTYFDMYVLALQFSRAQSAAVQYCVLLQLLYANAPSRHSKSHHVTCEVFEILVHQLHRLSDVVAYVGVVAMSLGLQQQAAAVDEHLALGFRIPRFPPVQPC